MIAINIPGADAAPEGSLRKSPLPAIQPSHEAETYQSILETLGSLPIYLDCQEEHEATFEDVVTRVNMGTEINVSYRFDGKLVTFSFDTESSELKACLTDALQCIAQPVEAAELYPLLGSILAQNPQALAEGEFFFRKQNNGDVGVYDPACGTAIRVVSGSDFPNNFHFENFKPKVVRLWQGLADGSLISSATNPFHFGVLPILSPPVPFDKDNLSVHSRFCGESIYQRLDSLGLGEQRSQAWDEKGDRNIPSRNGMMKCVVFDVVRQGEGFSTGFMAKIAELETRISSIDTQDAEQAEKNLIIFNEEAAGLVNLLEQSKLETERDKEFAFLGLLMLKASYIDATLAASGIAHPHLHEGNITWELVRKDCNLGELNSGAILGGNISFSKADYLADPGHYHLVTRMIDLGTLQKREE